MASAGAVPELGQMFGAGLAGLLIGILGVRNLLDAVAIAGLLCLLVTLGALGRFRILAHSPVRVSEAGEIPRALGDD